MVKRVERIETPDVSDVTPKPPVSAGLDSLLGEALGAEKAGQAANDARIEKEHQEKVDTLADDLADTLAMVATVAGPGMWWLTETEFDRFWGKKVQRAIADSGAEIMRRHGITLGDMVSQWGPYVGLAGALAPSAMGTVQAYKRKKAELIEGAKSGATQAG